MLAKLGADKFLRFIGPARIPGRLVDLGDFPGLVLAMPMRESSTTDSPAAETEAVGFVRGELFEVIDPAVWPLLDDYEGYDASAPNQSPFVRHRLALIEPELEAWVYFLNRPADGYPEVIDLSWPEYKALRAREGAR
jgi:hypothetical protein